MKPVELAAGTEVGEILVCSDCGVDLEVTAPEPAAVQLAPMEQEDWGEFLWRGRGHPSPLRRELMQRRLKIGVLYPRVRVEEKWIFGVLKKRRIDYDRLDDRAIYFDLNDPKPWQTYDAVLERSISYNSGLYALRLLNAFGVPTVNTASVAEICGDVDDQRGISQRRRAATA
ncbi:MAG: hypothetical protein U0X87_02020 [Anaerolineales bacterium]